MTKRAKEPTLLVDLLPAAAGDVLAARAFAETLLEQHPQTPVRRDARLLLTAACLQLQYCPWNAPTVVDLQELLAAFSSGAGPAGAFLASPMQFVQFAAAEFATLDAPARQAALQASLWAVAQLVPKTDLNTV